MKAKKIKLEGFRGFKATHDGKIIHPQGYFLTIHSTKTKAPFCRICQNAVCISMNVGKLVLLAFKPNEYKEGLIAIHKDGNAFNNTPNNLFWGTRKQQTEISMQKEGYFKRIQGMGLKYGSINAKKNNLGIIGQENLKKWLEENKGYKKVEQKEIDIMKSLRQKGVPMKTIAEAFKRNRTHLYKLLS
jgi:hypothetical protein